MQIDNYTLIELNKRMDKLNATIPYIPTRRIRRILTIVRNRIAVTIAVYATNKGETHASL